MLKWYIVEDNGNIVTQASENVPTWFQFQGEGRWKPTLREAIAETRGKFAREVESAEKSLAEAKARLERFLEVCPDPDQL